VSDVPGGCAQPALKALTGPAGADLTISVSASPGCVLPGAFKSIQLKTFRANGSLMRTRNHIGVDAPGGVAKDIPLGSMPRRSRDGQVAYPLVGDTVNTGSRLESLAPAGGILIGPETHERLPAGAVVEERTGLQIRGKDDVVDAYVLLALP
jgi:hypothetical protein